MKVVPPSRALLGSWAALLGLLGATVTLAYQPLAAFNAPIALTIAALKTLIVAAIFMELRHQRPLMLAFASAGVCWLAVLIWLASTDFTRRADMRDCADRSAHQVRAAGGACAPPVLSLAR